MTDEILVVSPSPVSMSDSEGLESSSSSTWVWMNTLKNGFFIFDKIVLLAAIVANCLVLKGIVSTKFGLVGYRRFLISLVASDLFVGGVNLLAFVNQLVAMYQNNSADTAPADAPISPEWITTQQCAASAIRSLLLFGVFAILLNLCGMSVDHYIGIAYPMQYDMWMNNKIAKCAVFFIWLIAFIFGFGDIFIVSALFYGKISDGPLPTISPTEAVDVTFDYLASMPVDDGSIKFNYGVVEAADVNNNPASVLDFDYSVPAPTPSSDLYQVLYKAVSEAKNSQDILEAFMKSHRMSNNLSENPIQLAVETFINIAAPSPRPAEHQQQQQQNEAGKPSGSDETSAATIGGLCVYANSNKIWIESFAVLFTLLSFLFLTLCYGAIFKKVSVNIGLSPRRKSLRKLILTTILLLGAFAICWLPMMTFEIFAFMTVFSDLPFSSNSFIRLHHFFNSLFMLHPLLDPIIYVTRVPSLRRFVMRRLCLCRRNRSPMINNSHDFFSSSKRVILSVASRHRNQRHSSGSSMLSGTSYGSVANNNGNKAKKFGNERRRSCDSKPFSHELKQLQSISPTDSGSKTMTTTTTTCIRLQMRRRSSAHCLYYYGTVCSINSHRRPLYAKAPAGSYKPPFEQFSQVVTAAGSAKQGQQFL